MERTTEPVIGVFRSWRQPIRQAVLSALLLLPAVRSRGQERITVLIPERIDSLTIDNRYQQPLSPEERRQLVQYQPITVLDESAFLGDAFTPCTKVEIEGVLFYLPVDRHRRPLSAAFLKRYARARAYHDTIEIVPSQAVKFISPRGLQMSLANERLRRYFLYEGLTYVRRLGNGEFGWVALRPEGKGKTWDVVINRNRAPRISDWLVNRVRTRINAVNKTFRTLYAWFNKDTGGSLSTPEWSVGLQDQGIVCALRNDTSATAIRASTMMLGKEFESYILGTSLQIVVAPGRIEIRNEE